MTIAKEIITNAVYSVIYSEFEAMTIFTAEWQI